MRRRNHQIILALALCATASIALAGASFLLTCTNEKCGFKGSVDFGGGFVFEKVTGYCVKCQKFVYLQWNREGKGGKVQKPKPEAVATIWDASTGRTNHLYACPQCTNAFMLIASERDLRFCPKCGQPTLKQEIAEHYD